MSATAKKDVERDTVMDMVERLGRQIAGARAVRRLSQVDVAKLAHTGTAQITGIENATSCPRIDTVIRIAEAVGLELTLREPAA